MAYRVFKRTWWIDNPEWPNGLEPGPGKRRYIRGARFETRREVIDYCRERNTEPRTAREKRLDLKYEYDGVSE